MSLPPFWTFQEGRPSLGRQSRVVKLKSVEASCVSGVWRWSFGVEELFLDIVCDPECHDTVGISQHTERFPS
jgi:hypothetical protein